jgi:hypothetical protein
MYLTRPAETVFNADSLSANGMLVLRQLGMPFGPKEEDVYECQVPVFELGNGCANSVLRFREFLACIGRLALMESFDLRTRRRVSVCFGNDG